MSRYQTWLAITMLAGGFAQAWADPPLQRARELQAQGLTAYKAADFEAAAEDFAAALALRPHDPAILYNFAACSAKAGRVADAIAALDAYATMGLIADVEDDSDFAGLNDQAAFKAVLAKFAVNSAPIGASQRVATISGEPFLAEGIAFDAATQRFFVSSVDRRKIVVVAHDGRQSEFATAQSSGLLGAFGMAIDAERRLLWVSATGVAHAQPLTGAERGTAGVFAYDLADGRLLSKTLLPKTTDQRIIGDIAVTSDGAVFAPDSVAPVIYMLGDDGRTIAPWLSNENFSSLQGITTTPDGKGLIVADYEMGLHFIDRTMKAVQTIDFADGTTLVGIDGLTRIGDTLIAVQNGIKPQRIVALSLGADDTITHARVLSANDPKIPEPSLDTIAGDRVCVVANAQWSKFKDDGGRIGDAPLDPVNIACIGLPAIGK